MYKLHEERAVAVRLDRLYSGGGWADRVQSHLLVRPQRDQGAAVIRYILIRRRALHDADVGLAEIFEMINQ